MAALYIIATCLLSQLIASDEAIVVRSTRPWEKLGARLVDQPQHDDVARSPTISDYQPLGNLTREQLFQYASESEEVATLLLRLRLTAACCYEERVPTPEENPSFFTSNVQGLGGMITPVEILKAQIQHLESKCGQKCSTRQHGRRRRSLVNTYPWQLNENKTINVVFDKTLFGISTELKSIEEVMDEIESKTCINFNIQEEFSPDEPRVIITNVKPDGEDSPSCYSFPGQSPGNQQTINLRSRFCFSEGKLEASRQFLMTLGLINEINRDDREESITLIADNIDASQLGLFSIIPVSVIDTSTPFDYGSIMLLSPIGDFSTDTRQPAFTTKDPLYMRTVGSSGHPTFYDIKQINDKYCSEETDCSNLTCANGGYPHPRKNCESCMCPMGLGGALCDVAATGSHRSFLYELAGADAKRSVDEECSPRSDLTLNATSDAANLTSPNYEPGSNGYRYWGDAQSYCHWVIKAEDPNCKVEAWFDSDFDLPCDGGVSPKCIHYVEIKYKTDLGLTGPRFCCNEAQSYNNKFGTLLSEGSSMVVSFIGYRKVLRDPKGFKLYYRQQCGERKENSDANQNPLDNGSGEAIIEKCEQMSPFTPCDGVPFKEDDIKTQKRVLECKRSRGTAEACYRVRETRNCGRCNNGKTEGVCEVTFFGQCLKYSSLPQYEVGFCDDLSYGQDNFESREEDTVQCTE